jgi:hypothetical protein
MAIAVRERLQGCRVIAPSDPRAAYERANGLGTYGSDWRPGSGWNAADQQTKGRSLAPLSVPEYLDKVFPDQTWLAERLLPVSGLGLILGAEKTGKSFFALQLALCVGAGIPFIGRQTRQTNVLLIEEEGSMAAYQRRLRRHVAELHLEGAEIRAHFLVREQVRLDDPATLLEIRRLIVELELGLVIVGPLSQVAQIEDENKSGEINSLVRDLNAVASEYEMMLLLVHHRRKGAAGQSAPSSVNGFFETARGSNALVAAIDSGIGLWREQEKSSARMYVLQRDSESFRAALDFDAQTGVFRPSDEPLETTVVTTEVVLDLLRQKHKTTASVAAALLGKSRNTAQKMLDELVTQGKATVDTGKRGRYEYSLVDLTQAPSTTTPFQVLSGLDLSVLNPLKGGLS